MANIITPTIPTDITIHLGPPNQPARNITVPFVEYIKNVATNEIYPNWPLDAIKANILAQISFALNRIYNEWYPAQGYDFDITSSPIYDQTFIEDSPIFETISQVVDDLFNNYIVRDNQVQPLFARYCDGKRTTCNGLSQWGSVELAKSGLSPIEILRYYYGDDISIVYDAPVSENIRSYPDFPISIGMVGNYIRTLKIELNRIRKNYPAIPEINNDSIYFDIPLENAVKKFQEVFDLPVTGIVDKSTWYKIKYLFNAVKKITDLYSEGINPEEVKLLYDQQLQLGSSGEYLRTLNYLLNFISYFDSDIPFLDLKGNVFDENTEQVLIAFQNKYNLKPDGIVNTDDWYAIIQAYNDSLKNIPSNLLVYEDEFYPGYFLTKGIENSDVLRLQNFLYQICEATHEIPGVRVNGIFDDLTEQSVKYIQNKYKIPGDGVVGPATWYIIVELSKGNNL